jgi:hypothetical protein
MVNDKYEDSALPSGDRLDLASVMAISGAALSPTMGRFSRRGFGLLLAVLNLRFGVWLNSPKFLRLTRGGTFWWRVRGRLFQVPSVFHVYFEAVAALPGSRSRLFVSDGGHFDNLGLVEILEEDVDLVVSLDASLEAKGSLRSLDYALFMLRSRGYLVSIDSALEFDDAGVAREPFMTGWFEKPNGVRVRWVYIRCCLYESMSPDIESFAAFNGYFPQHPTLMQFFSADVVDAYHLLGRDAAARADIGTLLFGGGE